MNNNIRQFQPGMRVSPITEAVAGFNGRVVTQTEILIVHQAAIDCDGLAYLNFNGITGGFPPEMFEVVSEVASV